MKVYRYFRWLSLDIVAGALLFLAYLGELYQIHFPFSVYLALGSAIWLIYTADHLIDSFKAQITTLRREFHRRNSGIFIFLGGVVLAVALVNVTFLPEKVIRVGSLLAAVCILYLVTVYFLKKLYFKELLIALGYSSGVFMTPLLYTAYVQLQDVYLFLNFTLIALANLLIFSSFEEQEDREQNFHSMVILLGAWKSRILVLSVLSICLLMAIAGFMLLSTHYNSILVIYGLMTLILFAIYLFPGYFAARERFRVVGDSIFFLPLLFY